jgi:hypothetical protein
MAFSSEFAEGKYINEHELYANNLLFSNNELKYTHKSMELQFLESRK